MVIIQTRFSMPDVIKALFEEKEPEPEERLDIEEKEILDQFGYKLNLKPEKTLGSVIELGTIWSEE